MKNKNTYEFSTRTKIQNFDRSKKSIQDWLAAWIQAENIFFPRRVKLMDSFDMAMIDNHLHAVIDNRKMKLLGEPTIIVKNNEVDDETHKMFKAKWFRDFVSLSLDAIPYGYSVLELNLLNSGLMSNVKLLERRNILPEKREVLVNFYDIEGVNYSLPPISDFYIHVESDYPLGLINKCVYWTIYKRMSGASHALFNENFGLPMLIAKSRGDDDRKEDLLDELKTLGKERVGVLGIDEELELQYPSGSQGAFQNFEAMQDRANNEMSKLFLGHVKGTDDNQGSQTYVNQNETNKTPSEERREADMEFIENLVNDELIPRLIKFGYPLQDCKFQYLHTYLQEKSRKKKSLAPELLKLLLDNYDIPAEFIEENFEIPVKKKATPKIASPLAPKSEEDKPNPVEDDSEAIEDANNHIELKKKDLDDIYGQIEIPQNSIIDDIFEGFNSLFGGFTRFTQNIKEYFFQKLLDLTFNALWGAVSAEIDYDTVDEQTVNALRDNIFQFAAAKTYQMLEQINALLINENGERREFQDFKNELEKLNIQFNRNYLATEYNFAIATSQVISRWADLTQDDPDALLTFDAVGDGLTTPLCTSLDGVTLPASNDFWDIYTPPNHWGCRSTIKRGQEISQPSSLPEIKNEFANNPSKKNQVFSDKHPYFENLTNEQKKEIEDLKPE